VDNDITTCDCCPERFCEVLAAFEHTLYGRGMAEATVRSYGASLRLFAAFYTEQLKKPGPFAARLQETDVVGFVDYLRRDKLLKASSLNRHIAAMRAFGAFLVRKRWHRRPLADELHSYRVEVGGPAPQLSPEERRRLIAMVDLDGRNGWRDRAIIELLLNTGVRVGELVGLCRDDVTLRKTVGRVRVRSDKVHSERRIELSPAVRTAIENYLERRGPVGGSEPLFLSERGRRLSVSGVQQLVKKRLEDVGRPELSVHALRHDFAQRFYSKSGELTTTQKVLGHRSIMTTVRYAQPSDAKVKEAMERLDEA
jgi:site-specific recombinase XerD